MHWGGMAAEKTMAARDLASSAMGSLGAVQMNGVRRSGAGAIN